MKTKRCSRLVVLLTFVSLLTFRALAAEPQWVEVASPNFRVYTDAGEKRGREIALHFEQMRFAFGKLLAKAKVQTSVPVRVIAFRSSKGFRTVSPLWKGKPRELAGFYQQSDSVAFIALDLASPQGWNVVFHEYAHLLLNSNVANNPVWFDEGFAEFYSTTKIDKDKWVIGTIPEYAPQLLASEKFIPLLDLFAAGHDSPLYNERDHTSVFYAESWLAVEYFLFSDEGRKGQLLRYLNLIEKQVPVAEAMKQAFGKDPAQLHKDLEKYFREGKAQTVTYTKPPALDALQMKVTPLDPLDAQATVAELRLNETDYADQARSELESILQQKPDQPIALRGLGYSAIRKGDFEQAEKYLERAMSLGSDDARVYFYWAMAAQNQGRYDDETRDKMRSALEKCVKLDPEMSEAYSLLAFLQVRDDFDGAMKLMKTAISLSPRKYENYINLASLYMSHGKVEEASSLLKQLVKNPNEQVAARAREMLSRIDDMKNAPTRYEADDNGSSAVRVIELKDTEEPEVEMKPFSGTLVSVECQSQTKVKITVASGTNKLVLTGDADEMMVSGKDFSCGLKGATVHGHYNAKNSTVLTLVVE